MRGAANPGNPIISSPSSLVQLRVNVKKSTQMQMGTRECLYIEREGVGRSIAQHQRAVYRQLLRLLTVHSDRCN